MLLKRLVLFAIFLTLTVVILGAYTRLADAGLGCPDWPGCYGKVGVPMSEADIRQAEQAFPERPVETGKAWLEMVHRYFASTLGLLILIIAGIAIKQAQTLQETPVKLPLSILALVIFQGLLGMWTVTLKLYPPVVMAHLLGGFTLSCLLWLLHLRLRRLPSQQPISKSPMGNDPISNNPISNDRAEMNNAPEHRPALSQSPTSSPARVAALFALIILVLQIALGGWTSTNYAAIACIELPICSGHWLSQEAVQEAFSLHGLHFGDFEFGLHLSPQAKVTIHMAHRVGALIASCAILIAAVLALRSARVRKTQYLAMSTLLLLLVQVTLGLSNIVLLLPLPIAVAHNAVALLLLLTLITLIVSLQDEARWQNPSPKTTPC